ncbi:ABC transporter G family member 7 [Hondaea fermentalgiana]|uniref:ABC transporter G family member 7 n=1 Tax=Hondaea fermentalgiana TaxID=2315210 RepID=A0A2R5GRJ0_9STRA|nr:ABC transporter G family member 7 [Hondaea fermentalgiana]|eukprot:GBG30961.1 ABC transporter G family member 7 [Hondaea fermentalgiana]
MIAAEDLEQQGFAGEDPAIGKESDAMRSWIRCENLNYSVKAKKKQIHILKDIDCVFPPGRLVALMGPSGAGKTTLGSNALTLRGPGKAEGAILFNGKPSSKAIMKRYSKLVPQEDILQPVLTARETLRYAAELALDASKEERHARAEELISMLSLEECADVIVGGTGLKGLSGGQRKRVSIALEMIQDPSVLILDEPTSGLDSKVAEDVVDIIKRLARTGRTVICTIHQPSFQVFAKFDWLLLLNKGKVAYNGAVDRVSEYLDEVGAPVPAYVNPADHFMLVLSQPVPNPSCEDFAELFKASSFYKDAIADAEACKAAEDAFVAEREASGKVGVPESRRQSAGFATSAWWQFRVLLHRTLMITLKDRAQFRVRIVQLAFVGLIIATIFWRMPNDQDRVQDRISVLFLLMLFLGMSSIMSTAMVVTGERPLVHREVNNNFYTMSSYYFSRVTVLVSFQTLYAVCFCAVVYFMVGFNSDVAKFFKFMLMFVVIALFTGCLGYTAGISFPNIQAISAVVPMMVMPLTLFAGLFIPVANIPVYWIWLAYLSPFQYALEALIVNEFAGEYLNPCSAEAIATSGECPYGLCNSNSSSSEALPCSGDLIINRYEYNFDAYWRNFGIIAGMTVAILLLGLRQIRKLVSTTK